MKRFIKRVTSWIILAAIVIPLVPIDLLVHAAEPSDVKTVEVPSIRGDFWYDELTAKLDDDAFNDIPSWRYNVDVYRNDSSNIEFDWHNRSGCFPGYNNIYQWGNDDTSYKVHSGKTDLRGLLAPYLQDGGFAPNDDGTWIQPNCVLKDDYIKIWSYSAYNDDKDVTVSCCHYDTVNHEFHYININTHQQSAAKDDVVVMHLKTNFLILPENYLDGSGSVDCDLATYWSYVKADMIAAVESNDTSLEDVINRQVKVEEYGDDMVSLSLRAVSAKFIDDKAYGDDVGLKTTSVTSGKSNEAPFDKIYIGTFRFGADFLDWGNSDDSMLTPTGIQNGNYDTEDVNTLITAMVSGRVAALGSTTIQSQITADNTSPFNKDKTIGTIISKYNECMANRLAQYDMQEQINALTADPDFIADSRDWYDVLTKITVLNIQYMRGQEDAGYGTNGTLWQVPDHLTVSGKPTVVATPGRSGAVTSHGPANSTMSWDGTTYYTVEDTLGNVKYVVLSYKDVYDKLSDADKTVLSTLYVQQMDRWCGRFSSDVSMISTDTENASNLYACLNKDEAVRYAKDVTGGLHLANGDSLSTHVTETMKSWSDMGLVGQTNSVLNQIRWCDYIGEYIIFTGFYGENSGEESSWTDTTSEYNIYDPTLASMSNRVTIHDENEAYFPMYLPSKVGLFGDDYLAMKQLQDTTSVTYEDTQWSRYINFMYNVSYGFDICAFSDAGTESGYTPMALYASLKGVNGTSVDGKSAGFKCWEKWETLAANNEAPNFSWVGEAKAETGFAGDETSMNMCRAIIQLRKLCDFLQIPDDAWTPAIYDYLHLYDLCKDEFKQLEQNPNLFKQVTSNGEVTLVEPMGLFFSVKSEQVSDQWMRGFALSSLYVPMQTNVYDASTYTYLDDPEWLASYFYRFGFYRKALYINTDSHAIVNQFVSGSTSGSVPATLGDLLNYDRDIILTIDDSFYNAGRASEIVDKLDYMSVRNSVNADQVSEDAMQSISSSLEDLVDLDTLTVLKTAGVHYYSTTLAANVTPLDQTSSTDKNILDEAKTRFLDAYLLDKDAIMGTFDSTTGEYEYTVKVPMAVVSAIYRSNTLYNLTLRAQSNDNAIFKSSQAICATPGTKEKDWQAIYNYYMLANLSEQMKNDSSTTLDLDAPIFVDLFGNIVTESGLVIIPAAANATFTGNAWSPCNAAFASYYYNGEMIPDEVYDDSFYEWLTGNKILNNVEIVTTDEQGRPLVTVEKREFSDKSSDVTVKGMHTKGGGWFVFDAASGYYILRTTEISAGGSSALIQWDELNKNAANIKQVFYNKAYYDVGESISKTNFPRIVFLTEEVLRGAPIEYIDYTAEGLDGNMSISKYGVYMAYKLDELSNALISGTNGSGVGNTMVTMPNLAFVNGIEYIVLYIFKITFAVMVFALAVSLYIDATRNSLGIKSVGRFLLTTVMVLVSITFVPKVISWSYYSANKNLLKDEMGYIMMLNYAKQFDGAEIGITEIRTPETNTELYLRLDDVSIDWWDAIYPVLFTNTYNTVSDLYKDQLTDNLMAQEENVIQKADALYMDVQDIFDSTNMTYLPSQRKYMNYRYQKSGFEAVSFVSPYYFILDQLITNVNDYNDRNLVDSYDYTVGSNGHVCTYGVISPYLHSDEFLVEGYDVLNMHGEFHTAMTYVPRPKLYSVTDVDKMMRSEWWPDDKMTAELKAEDVNKLYDYMRVWVDENKDIIGKVPDEVFLKTLAMETAIEYNRIFGVPDGNAIEIINVDTRDILRLMVGSRPSVYKYYSYCYSRYVYEESGAIGVVFSALLIALLWLTSFLKPALMIALVVLLIINAVGRKILFRKESRCVEGYLISCAGLALLNYAYAGMLKLTLTIQTWNASTILALVLGFLVQFLYVALLVSICVWVTKDWQNIGFNEYQTIGATITARLNETRNMIVTNLVARNNHSFRDARGNTVGYDPNKSGRELIEDMHQRDANRDENSRWNFV